MKRLACTHVPPIRKTHFGEKILKAVNVFIRVNTFLYTTFFFGVTDRGPESDSNLRQVSI